MANEASKGIIRYAQGEVGYVVTAANEQQACAYCRWFAPASKGGPYCAIVEGGPLDMLPTGNCSEFEADPDVAAELAPEPATEAPEIEVEVEIETETEGDNGGDMPAMGMHTQPAPSMWERLKAFFIRPETPLTDTGFKVQGDRWAGWYSNNYEDDEGEIFPAAEIDAYLSKVHSGALPYPVLQFAHLSSTTHGKADGLWRVGNFVLATGTFDDSPQGARWKAYYKTLQQEKRPVRLSHRYWYARDEKMAGNVYGPFETFEISWFPVLPGVRPANPFTHMEVKTMPVIITADLRSDLEAHGFSGAEITQLEKVAQELDARALAERRASKIQDEPPAEPAAPVVDAAMIETVAKSAAATIEAGLKAQVDAQSAELAALKTLVEQLTKTVTEGFALHTPASRNPLTLMAADEEQAALMQQMKTYAESQGGKSLAEMMAEQTAVQFVPQNNPLSGDDAHA